MSPYDCQIHHRATNLIAVVEGVCEGLAAALLSANSNAYVSSMTTHPAPNSHSKLISYTVDTITASGATNESAKYVTTPLSSSRIPLKISHLFKANDVQAKTSLNLAIEHSSKTIYRSNHDQNLTFTRFSLSVDCQRTTKPPPDYPKTKYLSLRRNLTLAELSVLATKSHSSIDSLRASYQAIGGRTDEQIGRAHV